MDLEARRAWLRRKLGRKIPDPVWDDLVVNRYASAGEMEEEDEELLLGQAESLLRMRRRNVPDYGGRRRRLPDLRQFSWRAKTPDLRREVFAECVANAAEDHPDVRRFREEVLGGSFPLTYEGALRYVDEDGYIREDAPHAQWLEELTGNLSSAFVWKAYDASWFVLCAYYTPPVNTFGIESSVTHYEHGPEIGRITLTVEPWVPAATVMEMYRKAQREMMNSKPHQVSKDRLRLLELVETIGDGLSWRECMNLWNELHSRQYQDRANFSKAYREIRASVLEPGYSLPEHDEEATRDDRRSEIKRKLKTMERHLRVVRKVERAERTVREVGGDLS